MKESDYVLAFSNSVGVGPKSFLKLLKLYGFAEIAWNECSKEIFKQAGVGEKSFNKFLSFKQGFNIGEYLLKLKRAKVEFIPYGDKFYPESLRAIGNPPIGLYVKGNKMLLLKCAFPLLLGEGEGEVKSNPSVIAVVGARKVTSYGMQATEKLVSELCSYGFTIVSGMALGVDGIAHSTAISRQGSTLAGNTIAVLGCGVDCPYPRENERLYEGILDSGGLIISEYPLGMPANPGTFPARNRIISGISTAVLVTEAAEDSGSLITADYAIKQGKVLFAVPGPITSKMSDGSTRLLKEGAILVSSAKDILERLNIKNKIANIKNTTQLNLSKEEKIIYECLQGEEMTIDEISKLSKIKLSKLSVILSGMELSGIIRNSGGKFLII